MSSFMNYEYYQMAEGELPLLPLHYLCIVHYFSGGRGILQKYNNDILTYSLASSVSSL